MSKLRKSAKLQECTLTIFPYCNQNPETVVLCHFPSDTKGMGIKSEDWWAAFGCSDCHDIIDGRRKTDLPQDDINDCMMRALHRTQKYWHQAGLLCVK